MKKALLLGWCLTLFVFGCKETEKPSDPNKSKEIEVATPATNNVSKLETISEITFDNVDQLNGKWIFDSEGIRFTITFVAYDQDRIKGQICCITQNGNMIDCVMDDDEYNFKGVLKNGKIEGTFYSTFSPDVLGKAIISKVENGCIQWEITQRPDGVNEILYQAVLCKEEPAHSAGSESTDISASPIDNVDQLEGTWVHVNKKENIILTIEFSPINQDSIKGSMCCVIQDEVDCSYGDNYNFKGVLKDGKIEGTFYSTLSPDAPGKAVITKMSDGGIQWEITREPDGVNGIVREAKLYK